MKAYKGFDKNMQCRKFQYVQGGSYELDKPAELCRTGFHAVLAPLDVFNYYPPAESLYHEVELDDVDPKRESDSKVAGRNGSKILADTFYKLAGGKAVKA